MKKSRRHVAGNSGRHGNTSLHWLVKLLFPILLVALIFGMIPHAEAADEQAASSLQLLTTTFKLQGERKDDNVTLNWDQVDGAAAYQISSGHTRHGHYRKIAAVARNSYDIYGLKGRTYLKVTAFAGNGKKLSESKPIKWQPISGAAAKNLSVFDNTKTSSVKGIKSGFRSGSDYYQFGFSRADDGSMTMWESTSKDGVDYGPHRSVALTGAVDELKDCKFESGGTYQRSDGTLVIWRHYEQRSGYALGRVICITGKPGGPFTVHPSFRPQGHDSRDLSLYIDDNGEGYLLSATRGNQDINIYKLTEDMADVLPAETDPAVTVLKGQRREAPALIKKNGWYYLFTSEAAGWYPSGCQYISAKTIAGLADAVPHPVGNTSTFGTQSGGIFTIGKTLVMSANRWSNGWRYPDSATVGSRLMPLALSNGHAAFDYYHRIEYDVQKGIVIPVQPGRNLSVGRPIVKDQTTPASAGFEAEKVNDGISYDKNNYYQPADGVKPWTWTVDLGSPALIKAIDVTFKRVNGSETYQSYLLEGSNDGVHFTTLKDCTDNKIIGFNENEIDGNQPFRYVRITVNSSTNVQNDHSADWARGIDELTVYGTPVAGRTVK